MQFILIQTIALHSNQPQHFELSYGGHNLGYCQPYLKYQQFQTLDSLLLYNGAEFNSCLCAKFHLSIDINDTNRI